MFSEGNIMYTKIINCGMGDTSNYMTRTMRVFYSRRLKYCPYGSCGVNMYYKHGEFDTLISLVSYDTDILYFDTVENTITVVAKPWHLSRTTAKHITAFLREYCPDIDYRFIRNCVYHGGEVVIYLADKVAIDNETGEVVAEF